MNNKKRIIFFSNISSILANSFVLFEKSNFEIRSFRFEKKESFSEKIRYLGKIISELRSFRPDFIYINDEFFTKNTLFLILVKKFFLRKSKIITFIANRYIPQCTFWNKFELKFLLKNIDFLFCRNKKEFIEIKNKDLFKNYSKLSQLYWGIPKKPFYRIDKPVISKYVLGFSGRVVPEKGLEILLESLKKLPDKFVLSYAGKFESNDYQKKIEDFIKNNNLTKRVTYYGYLGEEELNSFYNSLDLLVLPTTSKPDGCTELFGRVLVEAMFCQILVIGSSNGSIPEVLGNNKLVFKEGDSEALLNSIKYIYNLKEEEKDKIRKENYERAVDNFESEPFVRKIINTIYRTT